MAIALAPSAVVLTLMSKMAKTGAGEAILPSMLQSLWSVGSR
jgi:hypothetical protein